MIAIILKQLRFQTAARWHALQVTCVFMIISVLGLVGAIESDASINLTSSNLFQSDLKNVHIKADSLVKAWQDVSHAGPRTVLWAEEQSQSSNQQFTFDKERCTVGELLQALVAAYPDYTYTQDEQTGVVWLHLRKTGYKEILSQKVKVAPGANGLPMLRGVLEKLSTFESLGIRIGRLRGFLIEPTFNYPVDLPEGSYSIREVLNFCLAMNPADTFYVFQYLRGYCSVTPINLGYRNIADPSPSAVFFWKTTVGQVSGSVPNQREIIGALSSSDIRKRMAVRGYLEMNRSEDSFEQLFAGCKTPEETIWSAIGILSVMARTDETTHTLSVGKMEGVLISKPPVAIVPGVKALAAMELARVTHGTNALDKVAKVSLSASELADVKPDMVRNIRYSGFVKAKLMELEPQWAGFSKSELDAMGRTDLFSLP